LGPLVNKVKENQVETIVDALCTNMISENEQLRDICSIGLKTVISEVPITNIPLAANVCRRITGKLTSAIEKVSLKWGLKVNHGMLHLHTNLTYSKMYLYNWKL